MTDIYKDDILEIKRNFIDSNSIPDLNDIIELVDEPNKITRTYIFTDNDWQFLKEVHNLENKVKEPKTKEKYKRKKNIQDELTTILNYINASYNQKAANHLQSFITDRVPFLKEVEVKEKKTRAKTAYNTFISKELLHIKSIQPDLTPPERMKIAVSNYHKSKSISNE